MSNRNERRDLSREEEYEPEPISEELERLADDMVSLGLESLGETGKLIVTLAVEDEAGARVMLRFEDDADVSDCVREARDVVLGAQRKNGAIEGLGGRPVRYAIGYDGAVREREGGPYENALLVEYGEQGLSSAYSAYLLYKKAGHPKDFVWTEPAAAGETELLV